MTGEFNNGKPIQWSDFEERGHHPLQFSDIFLRFLEKSKIEIPETGHKVLDLLRERDERSNFFMNHVSCEGRISFLHLNKSVKEMAIQFVPYLDIQNIRYRTIPSEEFGNPGSIEECVSFEPELLVAALKIAVAGEEKRVSGWAKYHRGGTSGRFTGEDKRLTISIQISENSDRVNIAFDSDGMLFAKIDAGEGSTEELYRPFYDKLADKYRKELEEKRLQTNSDHT